MAEPPETRVALLLAEADPDREIQIINAKTASRIRSGLVFGMLSLFALTVLGASLAAFIGSAARWDQLSPVVDTVLAIESAALGSAFAYYMAKQD
jgi:hypothetical protein